MGDRVWRLDRAVPRLSFCGDVSRYSAETIEAEVNQMRATLTATFGAATAWSQSSDKLTALAGTVKRVAHDLAGGWNSEESVRCQEALQRIEQTARVLSSRSREMANFTNQAGDVMEHAVNTFSTDGGPGTFETVGTVGGRMYGGDAGSSVMGTIGEGFDSALGAFGIGGGPSKDEVAREHLAQWNQAYTEVNPMLPERVSAELPVIEGGPGGGILAPPGGYTPSSPPGTGGGGAGLPGADVPGAGEVPGVPSTGGFSAADATVADRYEPDGVTGGLASAGGYVPPVGAGGAGTGPGSPGTVGPAGGGYSTGGALAPGAGVAGRGATVGGAGAAGRGGAGGVAGRGGAGVRGGAAAGGGRPGMGMVGTPVGGGAAGGGSGGRGAGAGGRLAGAGGAPGRGAAGGMVPMAGAGARGAGRDDSTQDSWLVEDEDPWRGDGDAPPSVIG